MCPSCCQLCIPIMFVRSEGSRRRKLLPITVCLSIAAGMYVLGCGRGMAKSGANRVTLIGTYKCPDCRDIGCSSAFEQHKTASAVKSLRIFVVLSMPYRRLGTLSPLGPLLPSTAPPRNPLLTITKIAPRQSRVSAREAQVALSVAWSPAAPKQSC